MEGTMERPEQDGRSYRLCTLQNDLEVLLIHDPGTDKAGAALDVGVGSFSDPDGTPGVAHAVEHLLSMGTKKYPDENDYEAFLAQQGGYSNAFTSPTSTNYYFELSYPARPPSSDESPRSHAPCTRSKDTSAFKEALDRFGWFFIEPLFPNEAVGREVSAIDSEYKKNLQDDNWRLHQVKKALANASHPYSRFSMGNRKTLHDSPTALGLSLRDMVVEFYTDHYSANRMKLAVLGREPLDTLERWVQEIFSKVPTRDLSQNQWDMPLYTEDQLLAQTFVKPVLGGRSLELQFMYRDEARFYESQPSWYLTFLLGHKGPGSVYALLRANGWADDFHAGNYTPCRGSGLFTIDVELTEKGLVHYRDIVGIVFRYIAMVREQPPQKWVVDEMMQVCQTAFRFEQKRSPSSTASFLAGVMQQPYSRTMLLSGPCVIRKFDPDLIRESMSYLRPDNFRLTVLSSKCPSGWDRTEPWSGTEFKVEKLSPDFLDELAEAFERNNNPAQLHLPHPSPFLPGQLDVDTSRVESSTTTPTLVRHDSNVRTWWKRGDQLVPKGFIHVYFRTPIIAVTVRSELTAALFVNLVYDALAVPLYDATVSGLNYDLSGHGGGFEITLSGYNEKLHVLLEMVVSQVYRMAVKEDRFQAVRDRMVQALRDLAFEEPWEQISTYSDSFKSGKGRIFEDLPGELETITADDVENFYPLIFAQCQLEVLVHGNFLKREALQITSLVEEIIKPKTLPISQLPITRSLVPPPGSNLIFEKKLPNPDNVSHCIEYSLYAGDFYDSAVRANLYLLGQLTEEVCFNQLRTVEQLGYLVSSGPLFYDAWAGYSISVQSERGCRYVESRIEHFLVAFETVLQKMSQEDFEAHRGAITSTILTRPTNMDQEDERLWDRISDNSYDFMRTNLDAQTIGQLTKEDMLNFFRTHISPSSAVRSKLSVHLIADSKGREATAPEKSAAILEHALVLEPRAVCVSEGDKELVAENDPPDNDFCKAEGAEGLCVPSDAAWTGPDVRERSDTVLTNGCSPTVVRDGYTWRASVPMSAGVMPVKSMADFMEV